MNCRLQFQRLGRAILLNEEESTLAAAAAAALSQRRKRGRPKIQRPQPLEKKKRGRPRIHPIIEKKSDCFEVELQEQNEKAQNLRTQLYENPADNQLTANRIQDIDPRLYVETTRNVLPFYMENTEQTYQTILMTTKENNDAIYHNDNENNFVVNDVKRSSSPIINVD